jgi:hypothetical protein
MSQHPTPPSSSSALAAGTTLKELNEDEQRLLKKEEMLMQGLKVPGIGEQMELAIQGQLQKLSLEMKEETMNQDTRNTVLRKRMPAETADMFTQQWWKEFRRDMFSATIFGAGGYAFGAGLGLDPRRRLAIGLGTGLSRLFS